MSRNNMQAFLVALEMIKELALEHNGMVDHKKFIMVTMSLILSFAVTNSLAFESYGKGKFEI
jgi:hypothetical protein